MSEKKKVVTGVFILTFVFIVVFAGVVTALNSMPGIPPFAKRQCWSYNGEGMFPWREDGTIFCSAFSPYNDFGNGDYYNYIGLKKMDRSETAEYLCTVTFFGVFDCEFIEDKVAEETSRISSIVNSLTEENTSKYAISINVTVAPNATIPEGYFSPLCMEKGFSGLCFVRWYESQCYDSMFNRVIERRTNYDGISEISGETYNICDKNVTATIYCGNDCQLVSRIYGV